MFKIIYSITVLVILISCNNKEEARSINIYSSRLPELINPLIDEFKKENNIEVNLIYLGKSIIERVKQEDKLTKADVIIMSDIGKLYDLKKTGLTGNINDQEINENIPSLYRDSDGHWFGITKRIRMIAYSKSRIKQDQIKGYEAFSNPNFKGRVCSRPLLHPYNLSMVSAFEIANGEEKTKRWLNGFKSNLSLPPSGGDRDQMKLIANDKCDIAPVNHYYYGKMLSDPHYENILPKVALLPIKNMDNGAYANISGAMISKFSNNKEDAIKFIRFISSVKGQEIFQKKDFEIPVNPKVEIDKTIIGGGHHNIFPISLDKLVRKRLDIYKMIYSLGFDD